MAKELFPEIEDDKPANGTKGSSQRLLLLVLLLLVVAFGYLYFFTGLIRPREEAAKTPAVQTAQVRQPLPPRLDQGDEKPAATAKPEEKQPSQPKKEKPAPPPLPQTKPAAAPSAKPEVTPAQPPLAKTKPEAAPKTKPAAVPPQPQPAKMAKGEIPPIPKEQAKTLPSPALPAKSQQKSGAKPPVAALTTAAKKAPEPAKAAPQTAKPAEGHGAYTLLVGEFAVDREMKNNRARLTKLGIVPIHGKKITKPETMHRLFLADFDNHYAADMELQKLQKATNSAFILQENNRYAVYAGSYLHKKGAAAELKRLDGKGFKLSIKKAKVMVPITRVTAGSFVSSADAEKEAGRLRNQGIIAKVIKTGK